MLYLKVKRIYQIFQDVLKNKNVPDRTYLRRTTYKGLEIKKLSAVDRCDELRE